MGFCISCGQQHQDGIRFCRYCGNQQPGEQLLARLRSEAEQIHYQRLAASQNQNQNQQFRQPRW
ncbi:MAG: zinc-ribbon domain-containing protein [Euryarchaeota archaeon]